MFNWVRRGWTYMVAAFQRVPKRPRKKRASDFSGARYIDFQTVSSSIPATGVKFVLVTRVPSRFSLYGPLSRRPVPLPSRGLFPRFSRFFLSSSRFFSLLTVTNQKRCYIRARPVCPAIISGLTLLLPRNAYKVKQTISPPLLRLFGF